MAMINCQDCGKEMSDAAPSCPSCGKPNAKAPAAKRSVGFLLGIGILLVPLIFAWFTLRKGHSILAKIIAFIWLILTMLFFVGAASGPSGNSVSQAISNSSSGNGTQQVSQTASSETTEPEAAPEPVPPKEIPTLNARTLINDYKSNEIGADNKHKGNVYQIQGIVTEVKKDFMDNLYVVIGTGAAFEIPAVQAFFNDSQNSQLSELSKGQRITATCKIDGLMMNVIGKGCVIQ